jgi:thymidine kinase
MFEIILGSMKSGKSRALFDRMDKAEYSKRKGHKPRICLVRPQVDSREFVSRAQEAVKYDLLVVESNLYSRFRDLSRLYDLICIDEGQFFSDLGRISFSLSQTGIDVVAACLQGDRNLKPWKSVSEAIPYADKIVQVQAVCEFCGDPSKSTFTFYDGPFSEDQIVIGDGEFHAACADCWMEQTKLREI